MWRYRDALPMQPGMTPVTLGEGITPLVETTFSGRRIHLKMDHLQPTGSFKDRGASLMISRVRSLGIDSVVEDSSGNAGAAVAAYCARAGVKCSIFVPQGTPEAKCAQSKAMGAHLVRVPGSREKAAAEVRKAAKKTYYAGHCVDPFFIHGVKTVAYEICEQLEWRSPAEVVIPVGNGTLLLGLSLGLGELVAAGRIHRMPRIVAFQSSACNPLARAFNEGLREPMPVDPAPSIAEGIASGRPIQGRKILSAIAESGGEILDVPEAMILAAWKAAAAGGIFVEPTAAVALAGLTLLPKAESRNGERVVILTGHGLKSRFPDHTAESTIPER